ncbi:MAG: phosphatidate cytidylyltransferase [Aquificota bacterium]|nr:MAG: phosphatidate cytidylyltransferase [Aquificota bacterium]
MGNLEVRRKVFHLFGILLWLLPLNLFPTPFLYATFFLVLGANYLTVKGFAKEKLRLYYRLVYWLERDKNFSRPSYQALWANFGVFLSFLFFGRGSASVGVVVLGVGDAFASLVGMRWGKRRIMGKSLEGSLAFFLSTFVVLLPFLGVFKAFLIAFVCTFVELLPLEDNLTIPLSASLVYHMLK